MIRLAALGVLLVLVLSCTVGWAQGEQAGEEGALPGFASRTVPGEAVVDLADFVCGYVDQAGVVPDLMQVQTADGQMRQIAAAEGFVLLARTTYLWQLTGQLPASVPIAPDVVAPPVLEYDDVTATAEEGREVPTEAFLSQAGAVVRWVDRLQTLPTAVWVEGQRLSAAEYMAGLAICVSYAYWEGGLLDAISLANYAPPQSWAQAAAYEAQMEYTVEEEAAVQQQEQDAWEEMGDEGAVFSLPLAVASAPEPTISSQPELVLLPRPGERVSGLVDLVASYTGPRPAFVTFDLDRRVQAIKNFPPYSVRWDTSELEPGWHAVRVKVLAEGDAVLADQTAAYEVAPPESGPGGGEPANDL